jgi:hypothetical protein
MSNLPNTLETGRGTLWQLPTRTRQLLLIAPPLMLAGLTVLHPQPDHSTHALMHASNWFMAYHMIQLALTGLVAISVFLVADQFGRASSWPMCIGMGTFLVFFSAYDTLAGIGTGLAMRGARDLPAAQQDAVFDIVNTWPALDPWVFWLSIIGTGGWVLALVHLAVTARGAGVSRAEWVFLALAGLFLLLGHPAPFGTIAFGSLFIAALIHERRNSLAPGQAVPNSSQPAITE